MTRTVSAVLSVLTLLGGACSQDGRAQEAAAKATSAKAAVTNTLSSVTSSEFVDAWKGATVRPLTELANRHTMHAYYVCNPESPDGKRVVYYSSTAANGHVGNVCVLDRQTGQETVIATDVHTEDAHRAACQQFISGGRRVAWHEVRDGRWYVMMSDVENPSPKVVAGDHQLAFGQGSADLLPMYGCHWNPGEYRDLELVNVETGEIRTTATAQGVQAKYAPWLQKEFKDKPISIFFPVLSPDLKRVFLKIAAGNGGTNFMSKGASQRQGLLVYDFEQKDFVYHRATWGHPAWHPDSRHIIEMGNILIDSQDGQLVRIPNEPNLRGSHPSVSPDAKLFVTDGLSGLEGSPTSEWAIMVGDLRGTHWHMIHRFDNTKGAKSWRVSHPHPAFSADGQRIYFNVSSGEYTQLHVAEKRATK